MISASLVRGREATSWIIFKANCFVLSFKSLLSSFILKAVAVYPVTYFILISNFQFPTSAFKIHISPFRIPPSHFRIPHSHFRIPNSPFPIPTSAFPLPHSHFRIPNSHFYFALSKAFKPIRFTKTPTISRRYHARPRMLSLTLDSSPASLPASAREFSLTVLPTK